MLRILDRLEEILISSLMGAATLLIFVSVVHRFGTGVSFLYPYFIQIHIAWAQELCIYLFIWMAKFGAAYGVRTGIHVGVDVLVMRMDPRHARKVILFGLLCGALFTATIVNFGIHFTRGVWDSGSRSNDLEAPMWIVYLAIPLGSGLMCFRFLQVAWHFWRHGALPHHHTGHVEGVEQEGLEDAPVTLSEPAAAQPVQVRGRALSWFLIALPFLLLG